MIRYLKNSEIDRIKWDGCVTKSPGTKAYGSSWYLDIMAPGWAGLVIDDYESVFPVPGFKRFGINYVATPIFLQQLGVYSPARSLHEDANAFVDRIPDFYRFIDLSVGQKIENEKFIITERTNYEINLSETYEILCSNYSKHCRRNIERARRSSNNIVTDIRPEELLELFLKNRGSEIKGIRTRDYRRLINLINYCRGNQKGRILGVRSLGRELIYGIFLVEAEGNITMLLVVNSQESRQNRTGYYIVDELIRKYSGSNTVLDFAGSSIPSIASFMKSFGSNNRSFYRIYHNRLVWPLKIFR